MSLFTEVNLQGVSNKVAVLEPDPGARGTGAGHFAWNRNRR